MHGRAVIRPPKSEEELSGCIHPHFLDVGTSWR
jgi:hypothetical protein